MIGDGQFLWQSILDAPDEDGPRLVFADWLEEQGDEARAEFIRVQIELARLPRNDPRLGDLERHERRLRRAYEVTWRKALPSARSAEWGDFERGFVGSLRTIWITIRSEAERLFAATPIQSLKIYAPIMEMGEWLANFPPLLRVRQLDLGSYRNDFGDRGVLPLAASPFVANLLELSLRGNDVGDEGAFALADSPHLVGLFHLDLRHSPEIGPIGRRALRRRFGERVVF